MVRSAAASWPGLDVLEPRQLLAFSIWDGGGGDSNWHNPLNWSNDTLPDAGDNVLIDTVGHPTIHRSANVSDTIASLWSLNPIDISAGSLTVNGQWKQSAALIISGGQVHGAGNLIINGDALWIGGTIDGGSNILVYPGRQLSIGGDVVLGRSIYNNGSLRWTDGDITTNGGSIQNLSERTFVVQSDGALRSSGAPTRLLNFGTLIREGNGATTTTIDVIFSNYPAYFGPIYIPSGGPGIVDVRAGTLSFTNEVVEKQGDTLYGEGSWMATSSTARLLLPGPDINIVAGTVVLNGAGSAFPQVENAASITNLMLSGGRDFTFPNLGRSGASYFNQLTIDNPGLVMSLPSMNLYGVSVIGGDVRFNQGLNASVLRVEAGATITLGGTSLWAAASITGGGLVRITGDVAWTSGTIEGTGQLLIAPSGNLHTATGQYWEWGAKTLNRRTVNYGTLSLEAQPFGFGIGTIDISNEIVNRGVLNLNVWGYVGTTAGTGPGSAPAFITNFGTFNSSNSTTLRGAGGGVRLNNMGTVHVLAGTLILNGGVGGGGTWITENGAELVFGGLGSVLSNPIFSGIGGIRQAATAYWTGATIADAWQLRVTPPGRLTLLGAVTNISVGSVRNDGLLRLADNSSVVVNAPFYNNAQLDMGTGSLRVMRDFNLTPPSVVRVRTPSAAGLPRILVGGNADLKGSIIVNFAASPQVGDQYDYMTFSSRSGAFAATSAEGVSPPAVPLFVYEAISARVQFGIV